MEERPGGKGPAGPAPPFDPEAPPIEPGTLAERLEETRLRVEALEREIAGVIADRRAGSE